MKIAGIGSRKTPKSILEAMTLIGAWCREHDVWVRSGHALGADYAFEQGAREKTIVYLPFWGFNRASELLTPHIVCGLKHPPNVKHPTVEAIQQARFHGQYFHKHFSLDNENYMVRNYFQVMGSDHKPKPVDAVVFWARPTNDLWQVEGGTGHAVRIARWYKIPTFNLYNTEAAEILKTLEQWYEEGVPARPRVFPPTFGHWGSADETKNLWTDAGNH